MSWFNKNNHFYCFIKVDILRWNWLFFPFDVFGSEEYNDQLTHVGATVFILY